jgi:hypothetical protein
MKFINVFLSGSHFKELFSDGSLTLRNSQISLISSDDIQIVYLLFAPGSKSRHRCLALQGGDMAFKKYVQTLSKRLSSQLSFPFVHLFWRFSHFLSFSSNCFHPFRLQVMDRSPAGAAALTALRCDAAVLAALQ